MTYEEARGFVANAAKKGSILGLESIRALMRELSDVQDRLKVVHIAGTNGKGSTLAYLLGILKEAGYRTGRYHSPAVFDDLECFSINGASITKQQYATYMTKVAKASERLVMQGRPQPTAFELETALAYVYFYEEKCDIVLIETGMGGDEDATNVVQNTCLSLIAPVSLDHTQFLGDTLAEIAGHKAGIIKEGAAVIAGAQPPEALAVIRRTAEEKHAAFLQSGTPVQVQYQNALTTFTYAEEGGRRLKALKTNLIGTFQPQNACLAIAAALYLSGHGFPLTQAQIRSGVEKTVWAGRFEKLCDTPKIYLDGGHNAGAAAFLRKSIEIYFTNKKIVYIIGVLADKDYDSILRQTAGLAAQIVTVTPDNPRALPAERLKEAVMRYNTNVTASTDFQEALRLAVSSAGRDGVVFIFGSLSYLAEIRRLLMNTDDGKCLKKWNGDQHG